MHLFREEIIKQNINTDYLVDKYGSLDAANLENEIDSDWFNEYVSIGQLEVDSNFTIGKYKYRHNQREHERQYIFGQCINIFECGDTEVVEFRPYDFFCDKKLESEICARLVSFFGTKQYSLDLESQFKIFIVVSI